jgi:hypothetical protein
MTGSQVNITVTKYSEKCKADMVILGEMNCTYRIQKYSLIVNRVNACCRGFLKCTVVHEYVTFPWKDY